MALLGARLTMAGGGLPYKEGSYIENSDGLVIYTIPDFGRSFSDNLTYELDLCYNSGGAKKTSGSGFMGFYRPNYAEGVGRFFISGSDTSTFQNAIFGSDGNFYGTSIPSIYNTTGTHDVMKRVVYIDNSGYIHSVISVRDETISDIKDNSFSIGKFTDSIGGIFGDCDSSDGITTTSTCCTTVGSRFYSFKMYVDGKLIHDCHPVLKNEKPAIIDMVDKSYIYHKYGTPVYHES